jgi:hypothetical protein
MQAGISTLPTMNWIFQMVWLQRSRKFSRSGLDQAKSNMIDQGEP